MSILSSLPTVILKKNRHESLKRFHPWIFSGAIARQPRGLSLGAVVQVEDSSGAPLGVGFFEGGSIAVRMLCFEHESFVSVEQLIAQRLEQAFELRCLLGLVRPNGVESSEPQISQVESRNNCFRLCYGESDRLPGLVIDLYESVAVVQAHSYGMVHYVHYVAQLLLEQKVLGITSVYYKSALSQPTAVEQALEEGYLSATVPTQEVIATENGIRFFPDWEKGQKTGFFTDQRINRERIEPLTKDLRVLNLFCYTGGFSLYAMRGGAIEVISVDSSARAIELCEKNVDLNQFSRPERHIPMVADAFEFLQNTPCGRHDLIILDPPAFAKQRHNLRQGLAGYRKLNTLALQKVRTGGLVATFSCSQAVSVQDFTLAVLTAAIQSGRKVQILERFSQSPDHPVSIYHPESEYLKGLLLHVTD